LSRSAVAVEAIPGCIVVTGLSEGCELPEQGAEAGYRVRLF
jgi:hypothetical protein